MAKILVSAENFAFGPISKLVTVADRLIENGHELIFVGYGTSYQLGSKLKCKKIYKLNTDAKYFFKKAKKIFEECDLVLTSGDRSSVLLAQKIGKPVIWLDILFWWWDIIPDYLLNVDLYIQQYSLNNERNIKKYGDKVKNLQTVGPIINMKYKNNKTKSQLLIAFGGMEAKGWYKIGKDSNYPFTISKIITQLVDTSKYEKVIFVGNEVITKRLSKKYGNKKFIFKILPHNEAIKEMTESTDVLIIPGLETPLEAFAYFKPILFLPPSNSSQYVQLDEFRDRKLADKINSIHFADYYKYKNLHGKNLRKIMEIFLKELRVYERDDKALTDTAQRITSYLNMSVKEKNKQIVNQKKFMKSLGENGLDNTVKLIEKFAARIITTKK